MAKPDDDTILGAIENKIQEMANMGAAMAWSTPDAGMVEEFGEDVIVRAWFGDQVAENGDPVAGGGDRPEEFLRPIPKGYRRQPGGGKVPTTEEELESEAVVRYAHQDLEEDYGKFPIAAVDRLFRKEHGKKDLIYVSVSGDVEVWAKPR